MKLFATDADSPSISSAKKNLDPKKKQLKPKHTTTPAIEGDITMAHDDMRNEHRSSQLSIIDEVNIIVIIATTKIIYI